MTQAGDADGVLVLGNQLTTQVGPLADRDADVPVVMVESKAAGRRVPYHPHRLALVYSAMRHFRERLVSRGYDVHYIKADTMKAGLSKVFTTTDVDSLVTMSPPKHGDKAELADAADAAGGELSFVTNEQFIISPSLFDEWMDDPPYRHETFYRKVREHTGYLMDDGNPVGGEWNYDDENQKTPPKGYQPSKPPTYEPDEITNDVLEMIDAEFDGSYEAPPYGGNWADPEPFHWPVTREQALDALDTFIETRLSDFGPYQDAMVQDEPLMNHSLLSPLLHLGLLQPEEVTERAIDAYHNDDDVPLNSVEGFIRQIIGWREFVRHIYRRTMPELVTENQLQATRPLPDSFWTGETDMECLADVVEGVRKRGYAHHIERLMIVANFATLAGINPAALNRWFEAGFVDGFHWASTPNVVGMGTYGSGVMSTKPYVSSANYVNKMSDYCSDCKYDKDATTGINACPFNTLYWNFLAEHEDRLRSNHRMGLVYSHLDRKSDEEITEIQSQANEYLEQLDNSAL